MLAPLERRCELLGGAGGRAARCTFGSAASLPLGGGCGGGAVTPFPHRAQTAVGYSRCFSDPLLEKTAINKHKQGAGPSLSPLQGGVSPLLGGSLKTSRTLARHRGVCVWGGGVPSPRRRDRDAAGREDPGAALLLLLPPWWRGRAGPVPPPPPHRPPAGAADVSAPSPPPPAPANMAAAPPPDPRLLFALLLLLPPPPSPLCAAAGTDLGRRFAERKRCADPECSSEWGRRGRGMVGVDGGGPPAGSARRGAGVFPARCPELGAAGRQLPAPGEVAAGRDANVACLRGGISQSPRPGFGREIGEDRENGNAAPTRVVPLLPAKFSDPHGSLGWLLGLLCFVLFPPPCKTLL